MISYETWRSYAWVLLSCLMSVLYRRSEDISEKYKWREAMSTIWMQSKTMCSGLRQCNLTIDTYPFHYRYLLHRWFISIHCELAKSRGILSELTTVLEGMSLASHQVKPLISIWKVCYFENIENRTSGESCFEKLEFPDFRIIKSSDNFGYLSADNRILTHLRISLEYVSHTESKEKLLIEMKTFDIQSVWHPSGGGIVREMDTRDGVLLPDALRDSG